MARRRQKLDPKLNRYFDKEVPLFAPETGSEITPTHSLLGSTHAKIVQLVSPSRESHFEGKSESINRGKRKFSYPIISLMLRKEYGDVQSALEQKVAANFNVEYEPFIVEEDGEFRCIGGPARNPFSVTEAKTYDPRKKESIGKQLSVGKAVNKGDVFEWSTTINY